jgi:hypothetical protein
MWESKATFELVYWKSKFTWNSHFDKVCKYRGRTEQKACNEKVDINREYTENNIIRIFSSPA